MDEGHAKSVIRAGRDAVYVGAPLLDRRVFLAGAGACAALALGGLACALSRVARADTPGESDPGEFDTVPGGPDGSESLSLTDAAGRPGSDDAQTTDATITPREATELANAAYSDARLAKLTYSNLDSQTAVEEVSSVLLDAGIEPDRIETVMAWVADFNDCMQGCPSFELVGDFRQVEDGVVDYGSYYEKSTQWFKTNARNYHDVLCRIVAFELVAPRVGVASPVPREAWPAGEFEDMGTDGFILFGGEAGDFHDAYEPYPLLSWDDEAISTYWTLFCPVEIKAKMDSGDKAGALDETTIQDAVATAWDERGVSFEAVSGGSADAGMGCQLLTMWGCPASGGRVCNYHAAVVCPCEAGLMLFEKVNPEDPYAATYFETIEQAKAHLWGQLAIDNSRYGDPDPGPLAFFLNDEPA